MRDVYDAAYDRLTEFESDDKGLVIVGNPGIGKSFGLLYVLRKLLLAKKKVCSVNSRTDFCKADMFCPMEDGSYEVYTCTFDPHFRSSVARDFTLIDPSEEGERDDLRPHTGQTIKAASLNEKKHFHNYDKLDFYKLFARMWELKELKVAAPYFLKNFSKESKGNTEETLKDRFNVVGGAPRYLFDDGKYEERLKMTESEVIKLTYEKLISVLFTPTQQGKEDVSGHLFKISPFVDEEMGVDYKTFAISVLSPYVKKYMFSTHRNLFLKITEFRRSDDDNTNVGKLFEDLALDVLRTASRKKFRIRRLGQLKTDEKKEFNISGRTDCEDLIVSMKQSSNNDNHNLLVPKQPNFPVIDAAYQDNTGFQVTIDPHHGIQLPALVERLLVPLGYVTVENKNGLKSVTLTSDDVKHKFRIYFVVPFFKFEKYPKQSFQDTTRYTDDSVKIVKNIMELYCLSIDKKKGE